MSSTERARAFQDRQRLRDKGGLLSWQQKAVKAVEDVIKPIVVISIPRSNGKTWLAARLAVRCLTPGDRLFEPASESVLVSASRQQAGFVTRYKRKMLAGNDDYRFATAPSGPGSVTHKPSGTLIKTFSASPKFTQGIAHARICICDECGSWIGANGMAAWESIEGALGKGPLTILAVSTITPSPPGSWWHDLALGEERDDVYRYTLSADPALSW